MHSYSSRDAARFIALGALFAISVYQWVWFVWVRMSSRQQHWWYLAARMRWSFLVAALMTSCLTIVTILDIILDP